MCQGNPPHIKLQTWILAQKVARTAFIVHFEAFWDDENDEILVRPPVKVKVLGKMTWIPALCTSNMMPK